MQNSIALKVLLVVAGLIGAIIGAGILIAPVQFHATSGIVLDSNASLMSEIRAPGGALLAGGLIILAGAFVKRLTYTATLLTTLLYLSYGLARIFSIMIDGLPDTALLAATSIELIIGLLAGFALIRFQSRSVRTPSFAQTA